MSERLAWVAFVSAVLLHLAVVILFFMFSEKQEQQQNIVMRLVSVSPEEYLSKNTLSVVKNSKKRESSKEDRVQKRLGSYEGKVDDTLGVKMSVSQRENNEISWREKLKQLEQEDAKRRSFQTKLREVIQTALRQNKTSVLPNTGNCNTEEEKNHLHLENARNIGRLAFLLPDNLLPSKFLQEIIELERRFEKGRLKMRLLLPARTVALPLELPDGKLMLLGHPKLYCEIGLRFSKNLFPIFFEKMPVWLLDEDQKVNLLFLNVKLTLDGEISISSAIKHRLIEGLPRNLKLRNKVALQRTLRRQFNIFKSLRSFFNGP